MDRQKCFDIAATELLLQGHKSLQYKGNDDDEKCAYRGEDGKCAVGFLIPDDHYHHEMEDKTASQLCRDFPDLGPLLDGRTERDIMFLTDLQIVHDEFLPEHWRTAFKDLASKWGLDPSAVDKQSECC